MTIYASNDDINEQLNHCSRAADLGRSAYPGMSYEDGVRAAIEWLTGVSSYTPVAATDIFEDETA